MGLLGSQGHREPAIITRGRSRPATPWATTNEASFSSAVRQPLHVASPSHLHAQRHLRAGDHVPCSTLFERWRLCARARVRDFDVTAAITAAGKVSCSWISLPNLAVAVEARPWSTPGPPIVRQVRSPDRFRRGP